MTIGNNAFAQNVLLPMPKNNLTFVKTKVNDTKIERILLKEKNETI